MADQYAPSDELQQKLIDVGYVVKASDDERFFLWKEYTIYELKKYVKKWEDDRRGHWQHIGEVDGRPICMSVDFATIDGMLVAFISLTSQLCDYKMLDEWMEKYIPVAQYDAKKDNRVKITNAMNFSHVIHEIQRQQTE